MSEKKIAVVTGGARGIGKAIALELAKAGNLVVINYNGSEEKARETNQKKCIITRKELMKKFIYAEKY